MPWVLGEDGPIIQPNKSWKCLAGITHPSNWMVWTSEVKIEKGLKLVDELPPYNSKFYKGYDKNLKLVPRAIETEYWVDEKGNPKIDTATGKQGFTLGLKGQLIEEIKMQAYNLLEPTDWMVIRSVESRRHKVDPDISNYRAAVRAFTNDIEKRINATRTMQQFLKLYQPVLDEDGNQIAPAPIDDWPPTT